MKNQSQHSNSLTKLLEEAGICFTVVFDGEAIGCPAHGDTLLAAA